MSEAPKRACRLTAKIEADTPRDMANALNSLADSAERGELTVGCWGGVHNGVIYEYIAGLEPSHDEYFRNLRAYLDEKKTESP